MNQRVWAVAVAMAAFIGWGSAHAQAVSLGFVDVDRILQESKPGQQSRAELDEEAAGYNRKLEEISAEARKIQEDLDKNGVTMSERDRTQRERRIEDLKLQFERRKQEFSEEFGDHRQLAVQALLKRVEQVVARVAAAEKIDLVVGRAVAVASRVDITAKVIQALENSPPSK